MILKTREIRLPSDGQQRERFVLVGKSAQEPAWGGDPKIRQQ
jgi:hypothetical protein